MSRKISKSEKRVLNNADIFYKLFNELNNSIEYVFIGFLQILHITTLEVQPILKY